MTKESFLGFLILMSVAAAAAWKGGYIASSTAPATKETATVTKELDAAATRPLGRQSLGDASESTERPVASAAIPARRVPQAGRRPLGERHSGGVPPNPYGWPASAAPTAGGHAEVDVPEDEAPFGAPAASILGEVGEAWRTGDGDSPTPYATLRAAESAAPLSKWKWTGVDEPSALAAMTEVPPPSAPVVWTDRTDLRRLDGSPADREPFGGEAFLAEVPARIEAPFGFSWTRPDMAASTSQEPATQVAAPTFPTVAEELPYPRTDRLLVAHAPELPPPAAQTPNPHRPTAPSDGGTPNYVELPMHRGEAASAARRQTPRPVVVDLTGAEPPDAAASDREHAATTPRASRAEGRFTVVGSPSFVEIAERIYGDASLAAPLQQWLESSGRPAGPPTPGEVLPIPRFDALVRTQVLPSDD